jgi:hypothetical protein
MMTVRPVRPDGTDKIGEAMSALYEIVKKPTAE